MSQMGSEGNVSANVVLTANTDQYNQALQQSAGITQQLAQGVDALGHSISGITKTAGKTMLGISAADVANIGAATAAWAGYQKAMTGLNSQAAILSQTQKTGIDYAKEYAGAVDTLRSKFGDTTSDAAALVQQISKLSDGTQSIKSLSTTFATMSKATGESAEGLAGSVLNLQRAMGTPQTQTRQYADQLTSLAAASDTSATGLAGFASQIAPIGRLVGQSQTQITGIASAFAKAGQDGYQAANVYAKFINDIAYATQSGSPDLAQYANLVGLTVNQFKQLSGTDQLVRLFNVIQQQGPKAITTLNQMGLDGARTVRAVTAVANQGGLQEAINQATSDYGDNATKTGADHAETMGEAFGKLKEDVSRSMEGVGSTFGPAIEGMVNGFDKVANVVSQIMQGPFGKFVGVVAGLVGSLTSGAGALLLMAGAALKLSAVFQTFRSSSMHGLMEGARGGGRIVQDENGRWGSSIKDEAGQDVWGVGPFSRRSRGQQLASDPRIGQRPTVRWMYNAGANLGALWHGAPNTIQDTWESTRATISPKYAERLEGGDVTRMGVRSRIDRGASWLNRNYFIPQFDAMRFGNALDRTDFAGEIRLPQKLNKVSSFFGRPIQGYMPNLSPEQVTRVTKAQMVEDAGRSNLTTATQASIKAQAGGNSEEIAATAAAEKQAADQLDALSATTRKVSTEVAAEIKVRDNAVAAIKSGTSVAKALQDAFEALNKQGLATSDSMKMLNAATKAAAVSQETSSLTSTAGSAIGTMGKGLLGAGKAIGGGLMSLLDPMSLLMMAPMLIPLVSGLFKSKPQSPGSPYADVSASTPYLQAAGRTPPQMISTTIRNPHTVSGVMANLALPSTISNAQGPNYTMQNSSIRDLNRKQTMAYLSASWHSYRSDPKALLALGKDLENQGYTQPDIQDMFAQLDAGKYRGGGTFQGLFTTRRMVTLHGTGPADRQTTFRQMEPVEVNAPVHYNSAAIGQQAESLRSMTSGNFGGAANALLGTIGEQAFYGGGRSTYGRRYAINTAQVLGLSRQHFEDPEARKVFLRDVQKRFGINLDQMGQFGTQYQKDLASGDLNKRERRYQSDQSQAGKYQKRVTDQLGGSAGAAYGTIAEKLSQFMSSGNYSAARNFLIRGVGMNEAVVDKLQNAPGAFLGAVAKVMTTNQGSQITQQTVDQTIQKNIPGQLGKWYTSSSLVQQSENQPSDKQKMLYAAMAVNNQAKNPAQLGRLVMGLQNAAQGQTTDPNYQIAAQALQLRSQNMQMQAPFQTGGQQAVGQMSLLSGMMSQMPKAGANQNFLNTVLGQEQTAYSAVTNEVQQLYQMEQQQQQIGWEQQDFQLQRSRAQQSFNLQRSRDEESYHLQRKWSEQQYNLQRSRAEQEFHIQQKRNAQDQAYNTMQMVKQNAQQMYDIYSRVQVQPITSVSSVLYNNADQTRRLQQQESELTKLRNQGLSTNVIQQMGLTDPNNQQELQRVFDEIESDPRYISELNNQIAKRIKAAADLTKDVSSSSWEEYVHQYSIQVTRADQDFKRQMAQSQKDFHTQEDHNATEFHIQMGQMAQDYSIQMGQMQHDFSTQMDRTRIQMNESAQGMSSGLNSILDKAISTLHGGAKQQALAVQSELTHLNTNMNTELGKLSGTALKQGNTLMEELSQLFGFKFTPVKKGGGGGLIKGAQAMLSVAANAMTGGMAGAEGTVLPGHTVGRDNLHYTNQYGEALHLSGGEAVMVPEFVDKVGGPAAVKKLNRMARYGDDQSFAAGGIPQSRISAAQTWARAQVHPGDQYRMGGVGPTQWDCSGFMASITHIIRGENPYSRLGYTGDFPWARFERGPGQFTIGSTNNWEGTGIGHMAGTLSGLNVESRAGTGPIVGSAARGWKEPQWTVVAHLGNAGDPGGAGSAAAPMMTFSQWWNKHKKEAAAVDAASQKEFKMDGGLPNTYFQNMFKAGLQKVWKKDMNKIASGGDMPGGVSLAGIKPAGSYQNYAEHALGRYGWPVTQMPYLIKLWDKESSWNPHAENPRSGAYGIPQALPASKMASAGADYRTNGYTQIKWGLGYIKDRYHSPENAWAHETSTGWYGDGSYEIPNDQTATVHKGEMIIPAIQAEQVRQMLENDSGWLSKYSAGAQARGLNTAHAPSTTIGTQHQTFSVDKSTSFTGDITVQANNPQEFMGELQRRQRVLALTNPSMRRGVSA